MERIEKILASQLNISRSAAKRLLQAGQVSVNDRVVRDAGEKCDPAADVLLCRGERVLYRPFVYIMMNKPKGVLSASDGKGEKTVVDLLPPAMRRKGLFPAGRLDKDTTGFVLITDDGAFAHQILSPKSHVPKTYIAGLSAPFDDSVVQAFRHGVVLDGKACLEAALTPLAADRRTARVVIRQGMYHQVKRMFLKFGITVTSLHRVQMGGLPLDAKLAPGACRYLCENERLRILNGNEP